MIAEFMGIKYSDKRSFKNGEWTYSIKSLSKFRSSWDWLMPVALKIAKEHGIDCICKRYSLEEVYTEVVFQ